MKRVYIAAFILRACVLALSVLTACHAYGDVEPATKKLLRPSRSKLLDDLDAPSLGLRPMTKRNDVLVLIDLKPEWLDILARTPASSDPKRLAVTLDRAFRSLPGTEFTFAHEGAFDAADGTRDNRRTFKALYAQTVPVGRVLESLRQAGFRPAVVLRMREGATIGDGNMPTATWGTYTYWNTSGALPRWSVTAVGRLSWFSLVVLGCLVALLITSFQVCAQCIREVTNRRKGVPAQWTASAGLRGRRKTLELLALTSVVFTFLNLGDVHSVNALFALPGMIVLFPAIGCSFVAGMLERFAVGDKEQHPGADLPKRELTREESAAANLSCAVALGFVVPMLGCTVAMFRFPRSGAAPVLMGVVLALGAALLPVVVRLGRRMHRDTASEARAAALERVKPRLDVMASRMGVHVTELSVAELAGERLKPWTNAWVRSGNRLRITLAAVEGSSDAELDALLAHECAHLKAGHCRFWQAVRRWKWAVYVPVLSLGPIATARWGPAAGFFAAAAGCALMVPPMWMAVCFVSRRFESQADRMALEETRDAGSLASLLERAERTSPYSAGAHGGLFATHPPTEKRIEALRRQERSLGLAD